MDPSLVDGHLRKHLERNGLLEPGGRGVFATRDIKQDELVFADRAVVLGPRAHDKHLPVCVGCHKSGCALFPCDNNCGLPVCSEACQQSEAHRDECAYLVALEPECGTSGWSMELLHALVPIRALLLPAHVKKLFYCIQCNEAAQHGREVRIYVTHLKEAYAGEVVD